jgi:hypothetical protein
MDEHRSIYALHVKCDLLVTRSGREEGRKETGDRQKVFILHRPKRRVYV